MPVATNYIDFMAFADGARQAEADARARDQAALAALQGEQGLQLGDQRLQAGQQAFDINAFNFGENQYNAGLQRPVTAATQQLQLGALGDRTAQVDANRAFSTFVTDANRQASALPAEQRNVFLAQTFAERGANATPQEQILFSQQLERNAVQAFQNGDVAGGTAFLDAIPGQNRAASVQSALNWRDPAYYSKPENIAAAGGELQPDGRTVRYNNVNVPLDQFAQFQGSRALNATVDSAATLGPLRQQQQRVDQNKQFAEQLSPILEANGQRLVLNEATGAYTLAPIPQVTQGIYPEANSVRFGTGPQPVLTAPTAAPVQVAAPVAAAPVAAAPVAAAPVQGLTPAFQQAPAAAASAVQPQIPAGATPEQAAVIAQYARAGLIATVGADGQVRVTGAAPRQGPTVASQFGDFLGRIGSTPPPVITNNPSFLR